MHAIAELDERQAESAAEITRPPTCTECLVVLPSLEDLGVHLERHRECPPVLTSPRGNPMTNPCPRGCGRNIPVKAHLPGVLGSIQDWRSHVRLCDGQAPLWRAPVAIVVPNIRMVVSAAPMSAPATSKSEEARAMGDQTCEQCGKENVDGRHTSKCKGGKSVAKTPRGGVTS